MIPAEKIAFEIFAMNANQRHELGHLIADLLSVIAGDQNSDDWESALSQSAMELRKKVGV